MVISQNVRFPTKQMIILEKVQVQIQEHEVIDGISDGRRTWIAGKSES